MSMSRTQGKVKWFNNKKGFGFIVHDSGKDVFVHHTCIEGAGYKTLVEGEVVDYELVESARGLKAEHVHRLSPPPPAPRFRS